LTKIKSCEQSRSLIIKKDYIFFSVKLLVTKQCSEELNETRYFNKKRNKFLFVLLLNRTSNYKNNIFKLYKKIKLFAGRKIEVETR